MNNFNIVAEEPPAPAALVDSGVALAAFSFLSVIFLLLAALLNPPGAAEDDYNVSDILYSFVVLYITYHFYSRLFKFPG